MQQIVLAQPIALHQLLAAMSDPLLLASSKTTNLQLDLGILSLYTLGSVSIGVVIGFIVQFVQLPPLAQ